MEIRTHAVAHRPAWRRNAKQSSASLPIRTKPSSATSATSPIVSQRQIREIANATTHAVVFDCLEALSVRDPHRGTRAAN
jgi:hypothetical protein